MDKPEGVFSILYPKDNSTVGPAPFYVYGVSVYSNRDLIALLRDAGNDPAKMWMGIKPERDPAGDFWYFLFETIPGGVECNLEIWCTKSRDLLGSVSSLQTAQPAAKPKTQGLTRAQPQLQGPTISYPHAPGDNPLPSQFLAYGGTDDFTDTITAVMSNGTDTVNGTISGIPSQYQPSWNAHFNMGSLHGSGWTLTVTQGPFNPTSSGLVVVMP